MAAAKALQKSSLVSVNLEINNCLAKAVCSISQPRKRRENKKREQTKADLTMLKVGTVVRVIYPEYAAGIQGVIQAQETSGRWIVRLGKTCRSRTG